MKLTDEQKILVIELVRPIVLGFMVFLVGLAVWGLIFR